MNDRRQQNQQLGQSKTLQQEWQAFLDKLKKDKNPLHELLKASEIAENEVELRLHFSTEEARTAAKEKLPKIQSKMPTLWQKKRINLIVGQWSSELPSSLPKLPIIQQKTQQNQPQISQVKQQSYKSPLQAMSFAEFGIGRKGEELAQPVLIKAVAADATCSSLYQLLTDKTRKLADVTLTAEFSWRVRVGGMRGFRDLLLPVFHPVYGVPYIPSSSLKGAIRAWARNHHSNSSEVERLLGHLDKKTAWLGCVQILDAFPTKPCLSVDMANPQWRWQGHMVKYKPEPHALLSMEQPEFVIGLALTSRGQNLDDVNTVKGWLQQALAEGIGSRVSSGYGRVLSKGPAEAINSLPTTHHEFQLWTQGMYGAFPPSKEKKWEARVEFRPTAVRGMLRYWFRAIALGLYPPNQCKELEAALFGTLESKSKEGSIRINVEWQEEEGDHPLPYVYKGKIILRAKQQNHLTLIEKVLQLASHLAGVGRGSRRPLHWNSGRLRGCHWELAAEHQLPCDKETWQKFLEQVREAFLRFEAPQGPPGSGSPKFLDSRCQDVLNANARIYLVPSLQQIHPKDVNDWPEEGNKPPVWGEALKLLYSSPEYKGVNREEVGNPEVGGSLEIPSFVFIKSNFPNSRQIYQTVSIFGIEDVSIPKAKINRAAFEEALPSEAIQVWPLP